MKPFESHLEKNGIKIIKTAVLYINGDGKKTCDGCDEPKERVAAISMVSGGVECLCQDCIKDILSIWD